MHITKKQAQVLKDMQNQNWKSEGKFLDGMTARTSIRISRGDNKAKILASGIVKRLSK